jgi:hypothetical protein
MFVDLLDKGCLDALASDIFSRSSIRMAILAFSDAGTNRTSVALQCNAMKAQNLGSVT